MAAFPFERIGKETQDIHDKLVIVEILIFALPFLILSHILYLANYRFDSSNIILLNIVVMLILILAGMLILRQLFGRISIIATSSKRIEDGDALTIDINKDVTELHEISRAFNSLVEKLEQRTVELNQRDYELSTIREMTEIAQASHSVDDLMNRLLEKSMEVTGARIGSVFMVESETRQKNLVLSKPSDMNESALYRFRVVAAKGHSRELKKGLYIETGDSVARTVLLERRPFLVQDIEKDPKTLKINNPEYGAPSFLSMPIFMGNALLAVQNLAHKKTGLAFDTHDQQILSIIFRDVGFSLETAVMQSRIKEQLERIQRHNIELEKEIERRKRTEKALSESELQYRLLVENSSDIMYTIDVTGHFTYVNPVAETIIGFTASELTGKHYLSLVQPDYHEEIDAFYKRQCREKIPDSYYEFPITVRDGSTKWIGQNVRLLSTDETIMGFRAVARDITQRKLQERTLRESEERFHRLADAASEGIIIHENGVILDVNQSMLRMSLYEYHEIVGKNVVNFIVPKSKDHDLQRTAGCGCDEPCAVLLRKKDRTTAAVEIREKSILCKGREARAISLRDGPQRVRVEAALPESEEHFRAIVENAPEAIFVHTRKRFVYLNRAALDLFGASSEDQLVGQSVMSRFHPDYHAIIGERIRFLDERKGSVLLQMEQQYLKLDGTPIDVDVSGVSLTYKGQASIFILARDITKRKLLERGLTKTEKSESFGVLAGGIADDLNTLLQGVVGNVGLAKTYLYDRDIKNVSSVLEKIEAASRSAADLSLWFMTISKSGAPIKQVSSVFTVINRAFSPLLGSSKIAYTCTLAPDLCSVEMDERQMTQVFINIFNKAREAMPTGGTFAISADNVKISVGGPASVAQANYVKITIRDNGIGIPRENLSRIFDPYFSAKGFGSKPGTGLGLAVCHWIVKQHNGNIDVKSELGKGTTFTIYLPAVDDRERNPQAPPCRRG